MACLRHIVAIQCFVCFENKGIDGTGMQLDGYLCGLHRLFVFPNQIVIVCNVRQLVNIHEDGTVLRHLIFIVFQHPSERRVVEIGVAGVFHVYYLFIFAQLSFKPTVLLKMSLSGVESKSGVK